MGGGATGGGAVGSTGSGDSRWRHGDGCEQW